MKIEENVKIHNVFNLIVRDAETMEVIEAGKAENIVLSRIYGRLTVFGTYFTSISFGTGTGTLSAARTTLFTKLGNKGATDAELIRATPTAKWTRFARLEANEFNTNTLTEVGITEDANYINTHAMITDSEGNPLTIEKNSARIIDIYATVFIEFGEIAGSGWESTFINYIAGGGTAPTSDMYVQNRGIRRIPITGKAATLTVDTANKKRKIATQFDNYVILCQQNTKTRTVGECSDRVPLVSVTHLLWGGVGYRSVVYDAIHTYQYVVTDGEAQKNILFLPFLKNQSDIIEVKVNGVVVSDAVVTPQGEINFVPSELSHLTITEGTLAEPWLGFVNNKIVPVISNTSPSGNTPTLYSESGHNVLVSFVSNLNTAYTSLVAYVKDNVGDAWVSLPTMTDLGLVSDSWGYKGPIDVSVKTSKKYLRLELGFGKNYPSGDINSCQIYSRATLKFSTTQLVTGDVVTVKTQWTNEIPKDINYLINGELVVTFGEGV